MSESQLKKNVIGRYKELSSQEWVREYYGQSDYLDFGYWEEDTVDQKQACDNLMKKLLSFIPDKKGTILEVACGKGATTSYLLKYYGAHNITAIDILQQSLETAGINAPGCTFRIMDAADLDFADSSFDAVICVEAAFHFDTREKFLKEALRVLKPGGFLVLSDLLMTLEGERNTPSRIEKNYVRDKEEYRAIFNRVGFKKVEIIDATEPCWKRHFLYVVRYVHQKFLSREIDLDKLQAFLYHTYRRVPVIEYYLLVAAQKV